MRKNIPGRILHIAIMLFVLTALNFVAEKPNSQELPTHKIIADSKNTDGLPASSLKAFQAWMSSNPDHEKALYDGVKSTNKSLIHVTNFIIGGTFLVILLFSTGVYFVMKHLNKIYIPKDHKFKGWCKRILWLPSLGWRELIAMAIMLVPLILLLSVFVRPTWSKLDFYYPVNDEYEASKTIEDGTVKYVSRIPKDGFTLRIVQASFTAPLPPYMPKPTVIEIRGSKADGPVLASRMLWNAEANSRHDFVRLEFFSWFHSELFLVVRESKRNNIPDFSISNGRITTNVIVSNDNKYIYRALFIVLMVLYVSFICILYFAARRENVLRERLQAIVPQQLSLYIFLFILGLSVVQTYGIIWDVLLPEGFSFVGGKWTGLGGFVRLTDNWINDPSSPAIPFMLWPPGLVLFYAPILSFLKFFGLSASDQLYSEISYRLVQYGLALTSLAALYVFLVRVMKSARLPGFKYFPLLSIGFLALDPVVIFTFLTPSQHALVIPIFICFWVLFDRLVNQGPKISTIILFGLCSAFAILWRDEFRVIPVAFLGLYFLTVGGKWRALRTCVLSGVVISVPLLAVMTTVYFSHGKFAIHQSEHIGIALLDYAAVGNRDNPVGLTFNDDRNVRIGYTANLEKQPTPSSNGTYMKQVFFNYFRDYPIDNLKSWVYRTPLNVFSDGTYALPSEAVTLAERLQEYVSARHNDFIFLLLLLNIVFAPFVLFSGIRFNAIFFVPAV